MPIAHYKIEAAGYDDAAAEKADMLCNTALTVVLGMLSIPDYDQEQRVLAVDGPTTPELTLELTVGDYEYDDEQMFDPSGELMQQTVNTVHEQVTDSGLHVVTTRLFAWRDTSFGMKTDEENYPEYIPGNTAARTKSAAPSILISAAPAVREMAREYNGVLPMHGINEILERELDLPPGSRRIHEVQFPVSADTGFAVELDFPACADLDPDKRKNIMAGIGSVLATHPLTERASSTVWVRQGRPTEYIPAQTT